MVNPRPSFAEAIIDARRRKKPLILDGAVGTELDNRGANTDSPAWSGLASTQQSTLLSTIHSDYIAAGAEIITTATFRTTERAFAKTDGVLIHWRDAARSAVSIAQNAADGQCYIAGSVGPLEDCFEPTLAPGGPNATAEHLLLCDTLVGAGVDVLWLETFGTLRELDAAIAAAKMAGKSQGVPFSVSVTTNRAGQLISGEPLDEALALARDQGALAVSVNCIPLGHTDAVIAPLLAVTDIATGIYTNLGFADANQDWTGSAATAPSHYAEWALAWVRAGITIIGGCCGSTPAHIRSISNVFCD